MRVLLVAGIVASSSSSVAIGQTKRDLDAHRHDAVSLTMVLEPGVINLDFKSPWMNLVGFEHTAVSDAEHQAVYEAIHSLADPRSLFTFTPGNCTVETTDMDVGITGVKSGDAHENEHAHGGEHAHNDMPAEDDSHAHANRSAHSDVLTSYRVECNEGALPSTFTAKLMHRFPGIETLRVEFVGPGGQSAVSVTAESADVALGPVR